MTVYAYRVYDMSDRRKLYDVIAHGAAHAVGIVEHISGSHHNNLVVCDMYDYPIENWKEQVAHG